MFSDHVPHAEDEFLELRGVRLAAHDVCGPSPIVIKVIIAR